MTSKQPKLYSRLLTKLSDTSKRLYGLNPKRVDLRKSKDESVLKEIPNPPSLAGIVISRRSA